MNRIWRFGKISGFPVIFALSSMLGVMVWARAQPADAKAPTFGVMTIVPISVVQPSSLKFREIVFGKTATTESKSFKVRNTGSAPLAVTVRGTSTGVFTITQGAGQAVLQPKGSLEVTVLFAPPAAGTFVDGFYVTSNASKGQVNVDIGLSGEAKGEPPPATATPTPTEIATPSATPTEVAIPTAVPTQVAGSSIYVTNASRDSLTAYPTDGSGNIAPFVNISGANPMLAAPAGVAIDSRGYLYVTNNIGGYADGGFITVYPPGSDRNTIPIQIISGSNTNLVDPAGIAVDSAGNIYVADVTAYAGSNYYGAVNIYAAGSNGNVAPIAAIFGIDVRSATGVALDKTGNIFVLANNDQGFSANDEPGIAEYAPGSNGLAVPTHLIAGKLTGLSNPDAKSIALDPVTGDIYVVDSLTNEVLVFAAGSTGDVRPKATIGGANTLLLQPYGIAVDAGGTIYVANSTGSATGEKGAGSITIYSAGSTGNVAPSAVISAPASGDDDTELGYPSGLAVGP
jgi:sugar lactone lactonase YvrE